MDYRVTDSTVEGRDARIPIRDYIPTRETAATPFLWIHGGAFHSGGLGQQESDLPARALAASGRWVRTIDYRLAPKPSWFGGVKLGAHPGRFPAAHNDALDVAKHLRAASGGAISLGGASAGANIAAGAALEIRDSSGSMPHSLVLTYGTFHAVLPERPDVEAHLRGPLVKQAFNAKQTHRMNANYTGDEALLVPGYAFPGGADLRGLPPTLVLNSRRDRLRQSGDTFADELRLAGVRVDHDVIDSTHAFLATPDRPAYVRGITIIEHWLAAHDWVG